MGIDGLLAGAAVGLVGGFTSGLLGVSPGGGLVVFSVLLLGAEQHVAQGISLAAQIPLTSLAGIRRYRKGGVRTPARWSAPLAVGFLVGGVGGAGAAGLVSAAALQWTYVAYLVGLDALLLRRDPGGAIGDGGGAIREPRWEALLGVGFVAGLSSGFIGIGGGLATTVGLSALLDVPQRQAQMASSRSLADPDNSSGRLGLLARGRDGSVADAPRRDPRTCRRDRPRGAAQHPARKQGASPSAVRLRLGDGGIHGARSVDRILRG